MIFEVVDSERNPHNIDAEKCEVCIKEGIIIFTNDNKIVASFKDYVYTKSIHNDQQIKE